MKTDNHVSLADSHAETNARNWYAKILAMLATAISGADAGDEGADVIRESALAVQVRSAWGDPCGDPEPGEYLILLSTGGPALRITGELNGHYEPATARLEYQDWGTPWTEYREVDKDRLLAFASYFYYGG